MLIALTLAVLAADPSAHAAYFEGERLRDQGKLYDAYLVWSKSVKTEPESLYGLASLMDAARDDQACDDYLRQYVQVTGERDGTAARQLADRVDDGKPDKHGNFTHHVVWRFDKPVDISGKSGPDDGRLWLMSRPELRTCFVANVKKDMGLSLDVTADLKPSGTELKFRTRSVMTPIPDETHSTNPEIKRAALRAFVSQQHALEQQVMDCLRTAAKSWPASPVAPQSVTVEAGLELWLESRDPIMFSTQVRE